MQGERDEVIKVGVIGAGNIAEFVHIPGYQKCSNAEVVAICDSLKERAAAFAREFGIKEIYTDYKEMLNQKELDAVSICTPTYLHYPIVMEAIKKGKHILCEKPMGMNYTEVQEMYEAAKKAKLKNMVAYTYRFVPAIRYAKYLIENGYIGKVRQFRSLYLFGGEGLGWWGWRSDAREGGPGGVLFDLGSHLIDFARYLVGEIKEVCGYGKIFEKEKKVPNTGEIRKADTFDACAFLAEFVNGATGAFETSWVASGRRSGERIGKADYQHIEINGTKGTIIYYLKKPNELQISSGNLLFENDQIVTIPVPENFLKLSGTARDIKADESVIGFRYDQAFAFIKGIVRNEEVTPGFYDGLICQKVLDAVLISVKEKRWVKVERGAVELF